MVDGLPPPAAAPRRPTSAGGDPVYLCNYFQSGNSWNLKLAPVGVSATPVQAFAALLPSQ
ncbi:hypothetical protein AmDm5_0737 [Acetobacter malorum]|nr:hypothetical protein [Acetobacter malorum]KFL90789.1 hypothetical protein AmDm5_0737 [Acetobacter malorum]